ncbi:MAG: hypothetical protein LBH00_03310, partial [Planctomycetaceae bacterium]|nr:hypothetical protein [Planctomycetaceae bacterium]
IRTGRPLDIGFLWNRAYALVMSDYWQFFLATLVAVLCMQIIILNFIVMGGLFYYFIGRAKNQRREIGDVFIGFNQMTVPLILAGLITAVLQSVGFLFCILPGIYLMLIWYFVFELVIDKHLDFWDAMEVSRKVVHHHFGSVLLLFLANSLIIFIGLLACLIGVYFVLPFLYAMAAFAYDDLFGGMSQPPQTELSF